MAIITSYPQAVAANNDLLVGTKLTTSGTQINPTRNFVVADVVSAGLGYTSYVALLTQSAANPPVATELKNDTGVVLTWARTGVGTYTLTAPSNIFTANKTIVFINQGGTGTQGLVTWTRINNLSIAVQTFEISPAIVLADSILGSGGPGAFEIRIYT